MTFAIRAKLFGDRRRNTGREKVSRALTRKPPRPYLILLMKVFLMGCRDGIRTVRMLPT
jgi:hypothetical protein